MKHKRGTAVSIQGLTLSPNWLSLAGTPSSQAATYPRRLHGDVADQATAVAEATAFRLRWGGRMRHGCRGRGGLLFSTPHSQGKRPALVTPAHQAHAARERVLTTVTRQTISIDSLNMAPWLDAETSIQSGGLCRSQQRTETLEQFGLYYTWMLSPYFQCRLSRVWDQAPHGAGRRRGGECNARHVGARSGRRCSPPPHAWPAAPDPASLCLLSWPWLRRGRQDRRLPPPPAHPPGGTHHHPRTATVPAGRRGCVCTRVS